MTKKISDKDRKDWLKFINSKEKLQNKDNINKKSVKNFKEKSIDLHGYSLGEANSKVESLINESFKNGVRKLLIITGKGLHSQNEKNPYVSKNLGILRFSVPDYIKKNSELMGKIINISDAEMEDGGSGAFYIFLKKKL